MSDKNTIMSELAALDTPWSRRLTDLKASERVSLAGLETLVKILRTPELDSWDTLGIFPGEYSGLRIEFHDNRKHLTIEIDKQDEIYVVYFDFENNVEFHEETKSHEKAIKLVISHLERKQ